MKGKNITILGLLFLLLLAVYVYYKSRRPVRNFVFNQKLQSDKLPIKQAVEAWNKKLLNEIDITILLDREESNIDDDIHVAKTTVCAFTFQKIDATITLYPVYDSMSIKDKTTTLLHEIGHILGIGTRWSENGDKLSKDQYPQTLSEFNSKFNKNVDFIKVKNGHWDEPELMDDIMASTGGAATVISSITLANLRDLGWKL